MDIRVNPDLLKRAKRKKNPVKKKRTPKQIAATKKLVAANKKRAKNPTKKKATKKTTVRKKPVQAVQSKRKKPANRGAVIVALYGLKGKKYTRLSYFTGDSRIKSSTAWSKTISEAATFPTAPLALKVAKDMAKKIKGTRLIAVSRNATPAHMEKIFREGGYEKK